MPLALGPVGLAGMYARRGEVQAARAAQAAGVQFTLSTVGCCPLREVSAGAERPIWFQLYVTKDRGFTREMIAQAVEPGLPRPPVHRRPARARLALSRRPFGADRGAGAQGPGAALHAGAGQSALALGRRHERPPARARQRRASARPEGRHARFPDLVGGQFRRDLDLEGRRFHPLAVAAQVRDQGHPRPRGRARGGGDRGRRHRRFQPWRAPARRRAFDRPRAARHRRGGGQDG